MFKRIVDFFFSEDEEKEIERKSHEAKTRRDVKQNIDAKVTYKYPQNSPFRFPVIPDKQEGNPRDKKEVEIPSRKRRSRIRRPIESKKQEMQSIKNESNEPFRPTRVPSPIYGYRREVSPEVQDTPAFIRKQEEKAKKQEALALQTEEEISSEEASINKERLSLVPKTRERRIEKKEDLDIKEEIQARKPTLEIVSEVETVEAKRTIEVETEIQEKETRREASDEDYQVPMYLLNDPIRKNSEDLQWVEEQKNLLEETLSHF